LVDNKVGLDFAIAAKEPTSVAIASISSSGGASYSFYVENTADWGWTKDELPTQQTMSAIGATALQFGCLTMAMPPGNAVVEAWAKEYFEKDLLTLSHDVNVRPALGFDRDSERVRVERVNSFSHLIKASDDDINWLYGLEPGANVDQIAWDWIGDSAKIVFVTRGGDGASIYRRNKTKLDVASRKVKVQDSVGAGDTFCANTLAQLQKIGALGSGAFERLAALSDKQLIDIAKVSSVAASMTCEKTGAEPPTDFELADLLVLLA
jgi:fructokinase